MTPASASSAADADHGERLQGVLAVLRAGWASERYRRAMAWYWESLLIELGLIRLLARGDRLTKRNLDRLTRARDQRVRFGAIVADWLSTCPDARCLNAAERRMQGHLRGVGRPHDWRRRPEPD